jgi:GAF domain
MTALHRRIETRHLASARIQELHASRLQAWLDNPQGTSLRPVFMAAVAASLGMRSATVTLLSDHGTDALVATSDDTARAAHDLEVVLGEGPAADVAIEGEPVRAVGAALRDRWPRYGPVVTELGVQAVIAMPLRLPTIRLGALCAYDREPALRDEVAVAADGIADALTYTVLLTARDSMPSEGIPALPLFDDSDYQAAVHQATGIVSVHCECAISDAAALLKARAFADGRPVEEIALMVVRGELRLW